jgi:hypothetical protein
MMTSILIVTLVLASYMLSFFNVLMFSLSSRRWFVLCLVCIPYLVLVQVSGDNGVALSIGPN